MTAVRVMSWSGLVIAAWRLWSHAGDIKEEWRIAMAAAGCVLGLMMIGTRLQSYRKTSYGMSCNAFACAMAWGLMISSAAIILAWLLGSPSRRVISFCHKWFPLAAENRTRDVGSKAAAWLWEDGTRRSLPRKPNLKPGRNPEVFLRFEDPSQNIRFSKHPIYVAAMSFDRYRNSAWESIPQPAGVLLPDEMGVISLADGGENGIWHTLVLPSGHGRRTPLAGMQGLCRTKDLDALERWSDGLILLPQTAGGKSGYRYRICSVPRRLDDIGMTMEEDRVAPQPTSGLEFPSTPLNQKIAALADEIAGNSSPLECLRRIEHHLREGYAYSLRTENRQDLEPMENFLFGEKSGHCEYFATACALMARARGIPTRVVYGWAGGTWYEHADWFVFRADEAHAWTEAWVAGQGWIVVDATPEQARFYRMRSHRLSDSMPPMPVGLEDPLEWTRPQVAGDTESTFPWRYPLLCIALGSVAWKLTRPSKRVTEIHKGSSIPWRQSQPSRYLDSWQSACRKHRPHQDLHSTTLRQQLASWNPQPEFAEDLWRYHYLVRYRESPANRHTERQLARRIHIWSSNLRNKP